MSTSCLHFRTRQFIQGWFHQDIEEEADPSIEGIVAIFRSVSSENDRKAIKSEIESFLRRPGDLNDEFQLAFAPDIDPRGWGPDARQWLEQVLSLL